MKCSEVLDKFITNQKVIGNTKETIEYYKKRIGYFISFVKDKEISNVVIDDYNSYAIYLINKITDKGTNLSSATIKTTLNASKIFLKYSYDNKYMASDLYKNIKPYKQMKKTIVVLSAEDINKLLNSQNEFTIIGLRNLLAISLMIDAGLRVSEVVNLNVEDISKELGVIKVLGKGKKERLVPLTDSIIRYYDKYVFLASLYSGALFLDSDTGLRMTSSGISQMLRRIKKEQHFNKLHPHYLRHTFATLFLVNGGDPVHLQLILGHTTLYMTEQYLHLANQMTLQKQKKFSPLTNIKKP
jgi:site-specific recombinase XerD|nr:MAG TPA: SITE SPECIFIC RECOMBINASE XERD [Bacteriophage sp.]